MIIKWLGHSCFEINSKGHKLYFDPYMPGSVPGYKEVRGKGELVLCSHGHDDHNYKNAIKIEGENTFAYQVIETDHDDKGGSLRGKNNITIVAIERKKVVHFGDLGRELTDEEKKILHDIDIAFVPIGGYYTIDGKTAAKMVKELKCKVVIPMHYRFDDHGYEEIDTLDTFLKEFKNYEMIDSNSIEINSIDNGQRVIVLKYE